MHSLSVVSRTPMTIVQRTGTAPSIDCARRFSVSDPTRPRRQLVWLHCWVICWMFLQLSWKVRNSVISHYGIRWQPNLVNSFIYVRVYYLATVEWSGFLPGSSVSTLALKQQQTIFSSIVGCCIVATTHELHMELLPCTASSTGTWVNQLATLVQQLGWCRTTTFSYLESLGTLLAGIAMSLWRSTERYEDCIFWKRSVSLSFLGVFLWYVFLVCVFVWDSRSLAKTMKRINQTNFKTNWFCEKECVRDERAVPDRSRRRKHRWRKESPNEKQHWP